jgi:hypothetical protein
MDVNAKIIDIEAELGELKAQLLTATGEERIAIRAQITATQNSLTEYVKLLQTTSGKNSYLRQSFIPSELICFFFRINFSDWKLLKLKCYIKD